VLELAALFAIVFALGAVPNLIPATAVVAAFSLRDDVGPVAAVLVGATAITLGRLTLALAVRRGFERFVRTGATADNIAWLHGWLEGRRRTHLVLSAALAMPASPTTTIFVAAGALHLRLPPLALGFLTGRLVWYTGAVALASGAAEGIDRLVQHGLNPLLIAAALLLVILPLFLLSRLEWRALVQERRIRFIPRRRPGTGTGGTGE
jgi:uncharacterized membrane protein YdjX (TVP38/TMEM64 family)